MNPSVAVLIPTYARTRLLEEAIFSALQQDYDGSVTVIVFNDCPRQKLQCNHPRVVIVNYPKRFPTLGAKRHAMVGSAPADWVALLDDDDLYMPWHLRANVPHSTFYHVCMPKHWYRLEHGLLTWEEANGGPNIIARHSIAASVNVDPAIDAAPENHWRQGLESLVSRHIHRPENTPSYVYRVAEAAFQFSKSRVRGDRTPEPFLHNAEERMNAGQEPTGDVMITPQWYGPYLQQVVKLFPGTVLKPA